MEWLANQNQSPCPDDDDDNDDHCAELEQAWLNALGSGNLQLAEEIKLQATLEGCNGFFNDDDDSDPIYDPTNPSVVEEPVLA